MDHIPYPVSTSVPPVEIPFLLDTVRGSDVPFTGLEKTEEPDGTLTEAKCTQDQHHTAGLLPEADDGPIDDWTLEYWNYPQEQGWTVPDALPWWTSDVEETARRAQEFMYFELLQRFLGHRIDPRELVRNDGHSEKILLDSSVIPELLTRWTACQHASQQDAQDCIVTSSANPRKGSNILSLLARVVLECNRLDDLAEPLLSTSLAIRVLVETLTNAIYNILCVKERETRDVQKMENNPLLKERFLTNGWCPFQVARLWGLYSPSTAYYLSSLPREPTFGGVKHDDCDEIRCKTTTIDPSTYKPQHAESCSTDNGMCSMVGVSSSKVADCIKRGRIPLVRFEESVDGILRPEIVESRRGLRYVALSHVWSGGLGNVNMNSMLSCQVRKLFDLLLELRKTGDDEHDRNLGTRKSNDLYREIRKTFRMPLPEPPILLWIDTLCVPVGQEHRETRQSALAQMAQIYVEAQCVLVVDPELQKMNHTDLPDEQIFASILCSSWNSRSWTFQEACMARVFYIRFLDGHCVIDEKWHKFMKRIEETAVSNIANLGVGEQAINMRDVVMAEVSDWFRTMPVMTKTRGYDTRTLMSRSEDWQNFVRVWNGLRRRSTTKTDDLYGIIAIMVDLSADEILKLDPRERMKAILRSQSTLPLALLYQNCAKLCDLKGKPLWAPSEIAGDHLKMESEYMSVSDEGLLIDLRNSDTARHSRPGAYMFSTKGLLPTSFTLRVTGLDSTVEVKLHQTTPVGISEKLSSWVILCEDELRAAPTVHNVPGVLMSLRALDGSRFDTDYVCPLILCSERTTAENAGSEDSTETTKAPPQALDVEIVSLKHYAIKIVTDMSPWYKPKFRISKRLLSTRVVIRNLSNVWEFGAVLLTSNLYMFAIIGSATHHRTPLVRRILYFLVARYLTLFVEMYWVGKVIIKWDRERTSRWSTRLYGKANVSVWYSIRKDLMHPFFVTKIIPLLIGTVSLAVHYIHGWMWAKWVGIIAFTEIGLRLMFTCVNTSVLYPVVDGGWCTVTRADLSDMPEDMTNYSRGWRERNERDKRRRLHRRNRLLGNVIAQEGDRSLEMEAAG